MEIDEEQGIGPPEDGKALSRRFYWGAAISLLYCFLIVFKPNGPYLVDYLVDEKGFSPQQVYQNIFPMWTYSYFAFAILLAVAAEFVSYKACIVLGSVAIWGGCMLLLLPVTYTENASYLYTMYVDQWLEGFGSASSVIFNAYLFALTPERYFLKMTSYSRSALLFSSIVSSLLGTLLVNTIGIDSAFVVTLFFLTIACFFSLFLFSTPSQCRSTEQIRTYAKQICFAFRNWIIFKWLLWSALFLGVHELVLVNIQSLWEDDGGSNLNGLFYALAYGIAGISTLIPSRFSLEALNVFAPFGFLMTPMILGSLLMLLGMTSNLATAYGLFIVYHSLFEFMYPVSSVLIALELVEELNYAVIFSVKIILSLFFQTIFQLAVDHYDLDIHQYFILFAVICFTVFIISGLLSVGELVHRGCKKNNNGPTRHETV